jgi:hypothetical protein
MKNGVNGIPGPKLEAVISFQLSALNAFAIDVGSVLAALIDYEEFSVLRPTVNGVWSR